MKTLRIQTQNLHLDNGEIIPAQVVCAPGQPLEIHPGQPGGEDLILPEAYHLALARTDPHVHFRESYIPSQEEFEQDQFHPSGLKYETLLDQIAQHNQDYDAFRGSLAALKGGVWLVGAMGNTPWGPVGEARWKKTDAHYREQTWCFSHVWPRMEPGVPPVAGQEEKDFGSTFGGSGLAADTRRQMYLERRGGMISYHNDQARADEDILEFKERVNPPDVLLHHLYYDGETVLAAQRETIALAQEAELKRLLTRHIPTGAALDMVLQARGQCETEFPAEVGLDYFYFNRDMLPGRSTSSINYRRPALPSAQDQAELIAMTRDCARKRDPLTFFGSDHAPHALRNKAFKPNGLPGSPGTRLLEHTHQVLMNLVHQHEYSHADIDWLAATVPARYMAQYRDFPYPVGTMQNGAMANLVAFHPSGTYTVDEATLRVQLQDQEYHSAYRDESLHGKVCFTIVNGVVFDVQQEVVPLNLHREEIQQFIQ